MPANPITPTIPLNEDGEHHGFLRLPYSRDDSAWGSVMIPITVIKNGIGPTALLTGANHGDEYEGPVALMDLAVSLKPGDMLDFHSGGKTLDFIPFASAHVLENKEQQAACVAAVEAFNAPYSMIMLEIDNVGMYDTSVEDQGKTFVTTELGGGGSSTAYSNGIAKKGVRNVLKHAGIMKGELQVAPSVMLDMPDGDCFVFCEDEGLFEAMKDLGDRVEEGEIVARVWPADRTGRPAIDYRARRSGILASRHFPGLVKPGDCMAVVAVVVGETVS